MKITGIMGGGSRESKSGTFLKLAVACVAGCSVQGGGWDKPVRVEEGTVDTVNVGVAREALSTTQGVYVVGLDGNLKGAYCDGVDYPNDHGAAIQACMDKANADGGGLVLVRAGKYFNGTWPLTVRSNVTLMGDGVRGATLAPTSSISPPAQIIGRMENQSAVVGLTLDARKVSEGAIRMSLSPDLHSSIRVENNQFLLNNDFVAGTYYGIYNVGGSHSYDGFSIRGNLFSVSGMTAGVVHAIYFQLDGSPASFGRVHVQDNEFAYPPGVTGYFVALDSRASVASSQGVVISGNTMVSPATTTTGVLLGGLTDALVTGNSILTGWTPVRVLREAATACAATIVGNELSYVAAYDTACAQVGVSGPNDIKHPQIAPYPLRAHNRLPQSFTSPVGSPGVALSLDKVDFGDGYSAGIFEAYSAGKYRVRVCAVFDTGSFYDSDWATVRVIVNGAVRASMTQGPRVGANGNFPVCVDDLMQLNANDLISAAVDASAGKGAHDIFADATFINIERIGD